VDPFPDIKKESCVCASLLARTIPQHFHTQSESLIKPLLMTVSHQHSKVRLAAVSCIGNYLALLIYTLATSAKVLQLSSFQSSLNLICICIFIY